MEFLKTRPFVKWNNADFTNFTNVTLRLLCACPSRIYCTGLQHKAYLFPCLFTCLSSLCLQLLHHGSYLSFAQVLSFHTCTITSPFLRNADCPFFKHLPSPSRSRGMPLLALIVPQTLIFLSSNV